jgi:hypothetical protein
MMFLTDLLKTMGQLAKGSALDIPCAGA